LKRARNFGRFRLFVIFLRGELSYTMKLVRYLYFVLSQTYNCAFTLRECVDFVILRDLFVLSMTMADAGVMCIVQERLKMRHRKIRHKKMQSWKMPEKVWKAKSQ